MPPAKTAATLQPQSGSSSDTSLSALIGLIPERRHASHIKVSARSLQIRELRASLVDPVLAQAAEFIASLTAKGEEDESKDTGGAVPRPPRNKNPKPSTSRSKAAHRKKGDTVSAATFRPRGHGGRFKKLDHPDGEGATQSAHTRKASHEPFAISPSASTLPSASSLTHFEDELLPERSQRSRRPSTRYLSPTPSIASTASTRRRSSRHVSTSSRDHTSNSVSPIVETLPRLTIRIPARTTTRHPEHIPHPTSISSSFSANTSSTISTASGSATASGERNSYSPATTVRSMSSLHTTNVKQEEVEVSHMMDVDDIGVFGNVEQDGDAMQNNELMEDVKPAFDLHLTIPENGQFHEESEVETDSDNSSVHEALRPHEPNVIPLGSTSMSSRTGTENENGFTNGFVQHSPPSASGSPSKSLTFNQSWSDEEQRLLDILLQEIPDGTKNRHVIPFCMIL